MYGTIDEKQPLAGGHAPSHGATSAHVGDAQRSIWLLLVVQVACCVILTSVGHIGVMVRRHGHYNARLNFEYWIINIFIL